MRVTFTHLESAGRLGNQLWQIAATFGLARTLGCDPHVRPDWSYRPWFSIPEGYYDASNTPDDAWVEADACTRQLAHIDPRARMYLQDYGLFSANSEEIRRIFRPSTAALGRMGKDSEVRGLTSLFGEPPWDAIALHVRRGDTVTQPAGFQPLAPVNYYIDALTSLPPLPVVVFSDDIRWCRRNLIPHLPRPHSEIHVVDHGNGRSHKPALYRRQPPDDWLDLQIMTNFANFVISNSTYAWWAAWLSHQPGVRYPDVWWGERLDYIDSDLMIPGSWVRVPC